MDYERERRRQKRYREAMRNRIIAAVLLAGIIVGWVYTGIWVLCCGGYLIGLVGLFGLSATSTGGY